MNHLIKKDGEMKVALNLTLVMALVLCFQDAVGQSKKAPQRNYTPAEIAISPFGQEKSVMTDFLDDGGIDRNNQWWGLSLQGFNVKYDADNKSKEVLVYTLNTIKEVRNAGNILCGFKDGDWKRRDDPDGKVLLDAENNICKAGMDNFVNGQGVVTLVLTRKQAN